MNKITKYNLKTTTLSVAVLVLLFCGFSYLSAPQSDGFTFSSINPWSFLEGVAFALGFGLGFPIWLSVLVIALLLGTLLLGILWGVRKVVK